MTISVKVPDSRSFLPVEIIPDASPWRTPDEGAAAVSAIHEAHLH
jgi:hypothetical protein